VPRKRRSRAAAPENWTPARTRQIDRDCRWTLKRGRKRVPSDDGGLRRQATTEIVVPVFGYKNHVGIDRAHGFIRRSAVTHAAAHDGGQLEALLDRDNLALLDRRGLVAQFQRAKPRGEPMPAHIRRGNATRAKVRATVGHVFAAQKRRLHLVIRTIALSGQPPGSRWPTSPTTCAAWCGSRGAIPA
jgi:transposase, IS5 family